MPQPAIVLREQRYGHGAGSKTSDIVIDRRRRIRFTASPSQPARPMPRMTCPQVFCAHHGCPDAPKPEWPRAPNLLVARAHGCRPVRNQSPNYSPNCRQDPRLDPILGRTCVAPVARVADLLAGRLTGGDL